VFSGERRINVNVLEKNTTPGGRPGNLEAAGFTLGDLKNPKLKS